MTELAALLPDPRFRLSAAAARRRRLGQARRRLAGLALAGACGLAGLAWILLSGEAAEAGDEALAAVEPLAAEDAPPLRLGPLNLRADPVILRADPGGGPPRRPVGAGDMPADRVGDGSIVVLREALLVPGRELVALPSSSTDFAFVQALRAEGVARLADQARPAVPAGAGEQVTVSEDEGTWGDAIFDADEGEGEGNVTYVETRIEDTTTTVPVLPEDRRAPLVVERQVAPAPGQSLAEVLAGWGLDAATATATAAAAALDAPVDPLPGGALVAARLSSDARAPRLFQLSLYGPDGLIASVAARGARGFEAARDPWQDDDLAGRSREARDAMAAQADLRVLDAVFAAALRAGLPAGEVVDMLAKSHDLDRAAGHDDRLTLLIAEAPGPASEGLGRLLFLGLEAEAGDIACYVLAGAAGGWGCHEAGGGRAGAMGGLVQPVNGALRSGFGPRRHPVDGRMRDHLGVDWSAPTGTPVLAAAPGVVLRADRSDSYGNVVYLGHDGGVETRYAHLDAFAPGLTVGARVAGGQAIGAVGTTGRSTGPHLHFEVRVGGAAVDPLGFTGGGAARGPDEDAVRALVGFIAQVESGGRADAKNPLSTATGLGQFIESTWLDMMRRYRPDVVAAHDRQALLALRTDPELSLEMIANYARENESYLAARGHAITPGRLYLAHFLGVVRAGQTLDADPARMVRDVFPDIVSANGFLADFTIARLQEWSDDKIARAAGSPAPAAAPTAAPASDPPEVVAYIVAVDAALSGP